MSFTWTLPSLFPNCKLFVTTCKHINFIHTIMPHQLVLCRRKHMSWEYAALTHIYSHTRTYTHTHLFTHDTVTTTEQGNRAINSNSVISEIYLSNL